MYALAINELATRQPLDVVLDLQPSGGARLVRGLHKLASQAIFLLMTEQSSIAGMPGYGVDLVSRLGSVVLSETVAVTNLIGAAMSDLNSQLADLTSGLPDDEAIGSATLQLINFPAPDQLYVSLLLVSRAGDEAVYNLSLFTKAPA